VGRDTIQQANRESKGIVGNQLSENALRSTLIEDLEQLRDCTTGERVVDRVVGPDPTYSDYDGDMPDLVVRWLKADLLGMESPKTGKLSTQLVRGRTGDHDETMLGMFVATGPFSHDKKPLDVKLEDFAPTISWLLGIGLEETEGTHIAGFPKHAYGGGM
jgi:predicted AlkP superfamily phosphohydrolase/phosphomutase